MCDFYFIVFVCFRVYRFLLKCIYVSICDYVPTNNHTTVCVMFIHETIIINIKCILKKFPMHNNGSNIIIFLLSETHGSEVGQRRENGTTNPSRLSALRWR